jgi:hypothetical protein
LQRSGQRRRSAGGGGVQTAEAMAGERRGVSGIFNYSTAVLSGDMPLNMESMDPLILA